MADAVALQLFASAIAGRNVAVAASDETWTDGEVIYVSPYDQLRKVAVQASLIAAGSLAPERLRPLGRSRSKAKQYLALEGYRALAANETVLPPTVKRLLANEPSTEPPTVFGVLHPTRVLLPGPDDATDGDDLSDVLSSMSIGRGGPLGRVLARLLQQTRSEARTGPANGDGTVTQGSGRAPSTATEVTVALRPARESVERATSEDGAHYPEWDALRGEYRPDWCTVLDRVTTKERVAAVPVMTHEFRRALGRLEVGLTPVRRQTNGDVIDIDAAIEARANTLAGASDAGEVYIESLRRRRDLSALVLLDVSGSAAEASADGRPVHDHQRALAGALTATLHDMGDRVALYAFNSRGRHAVQMTQVVEFGRPVDGAAHRRLAALEPAAYTRMGAAIRHATALLEAKAGTPRRLLVVISDGFAYDHGYEGHHGQADARRALAEARQRGIGCACLSVATSDESPDLQRVFGSATYASLPTVAAAPSVVGPLFLTALRMADAQHKDFARRRTS